METFLIVTGIVTLQIEEIEDEKYCSGKPFQTFHLLLLDYLPKFYPK